MIEYFDSHCHLTAAAFRDDREAVLRSARTAGVTRLVCIASNAEDARAAADFAAEVRAGSPTGAPAVWSTAGVHPHEVGEMAPDELVAVEALLDAEPVVAVGETGLDYFYDNSPRAEQRASFAAHLAMGAEHALPVVVHAREADDDVAAALRDMPSGTRGVLHCFTGGARAFEEAMGADWYVSFSGIASFKSFGVADLLREVPAERLLVETDAPYLAPVPNRGRRNEPAYVTLVTEAVARHLGAEAADVARLTTDNARRFYGVD